ncbi:MAG: cytidylyltransferase family protein [Desulfurococcales archaeon]|nr:cytidylyltransferase family protein [Desulfurococcales archaeon]
MSSACGEEIAIRVRTYIGMVEDALRQIDAQVDRGGLNREVISIIELVRDYVSDAKYYMGVGDCITALSCVSYAEGLLDALARLGEVSVNWRRSKPAKVFVGGTFDLLHPGHVRFLKEASAHGLVYAVVARDENVYRVKGRYPILSEEERLELISSIKYVYKAMLGDRNDFLNPITSIKPDIVFLGPDQSVDEKKLEADLVKRGVKVKVMRMGRRLSGKNLSSSGIIKEVLRRYCSLK